tara:strand:- start:231 stop:662 length:432 start_codon:yes stop_codon:yes gene_type:complete
VIEGLKCDPNKPKVYKTRNGKQYGDKGYEPSDRECQTHYENVGSSNLGSFDYQLDQIKKELDETKNKIEEQEKQHNENVENTEKLINSLDCKRDHPKKGDIDCNESGDGGSNDEGEGNEVDLSSSKRNAKNDAAKVEKSTFKF